MWMIHGCLLHLHGSVFDESEYPTYAKRAVAPQVTTPYRDVARRHAYALQWQSRPPRDTMSKPVCDVRIDACLSGNHSLGTCKLTRPRSLQGPLPARPAAPEPSTPLLVSTRACASRAVVPRSMLSGSRFSGFLLRLDDALSSHDGDGSSARLAWSDGGSVWPGHGPGGLEA